MTKEVADDFPCLRSGQHNRDVRCFLSWMEGMEKDRRLSTCLSLVKSAHRIFLAKTEGVNPSDEAMFREKNEALSGYHLALSPTPDADTYAPGFVKANGQKCRDAIIESLEPICGLARRRQPQKLWFIRQYGDWTLTTHVEIRQSRRQVECYSFLQRSDFASKALREYRIYAEDLVTRLDPLIMFGIAWASFPLIGQTHELLCAQAVRSITGMFLPSVPQLIAGLDLKD